MLDISRETVRRLAGEIYFQRGVEYFQQRSVRKLREENGVVRAVVRGTENYRVKLWQDKIDYNWNCSCPLGDEGAFCKHLVAVGLAWIAVGQNTSKNPVLNQTQTKHRRFLEKLDKPELISLIERLAEESKIVRRELQFELLRRRPRG